MYSHNELAERAYHAGAELECLGSLVGTIIEQLDELPTRADPRSRVAVIANLARIAADYVDKIMADLGELPPTPVAPRIRACPERDECAGRARSAR